MPGRFPSGGVLASFSKISDKHDGVDLECPRGSAGWLEENAVGRYLRGNNEGPVSPAKRLAPREPRV